MSLLLDSEEIEELTGRTRRGAQVRVLRAMGIEHRVRPDGSVAVSRAHYERIFCVSSHERHLRKTSPDFSMVA